MRRIFRIVFLIASLSCVARTSLAQPKPAPAPVATDDEAADSPRASMRSFFDLAERGRYPEAALYLDLPKGSEKRGAELASKLHAVLAQRLLVNPEQLSPAAQGKPEAGVSNGSEELGKITDAKGHPVAIRIVRHDSRATDDEARWVFSQSTVSHVDQLYSALTDRWIRERLPPSLLNQGPMALYWWQWLALPLLAAMCIAFGNFIKFIGSAILRRIVSDHAWQNRMIHGLGAPLTLGLGLAAFALTVPYLALTLRAEDLVERGLRALAYLAFFWALLRIVVVLGERLSHNEWGPADPSARALSSVGISLGKIVVAALAMLVALSELGYPVTSVIAGLGIGGIALALAAQKTVENLFGSVSILADQPFRVGDTIRVDTIEGVVESIGLRSTRIRTVERTLVVFPNGKLADMRIESLGPRDRIRFATKLQLSRTTPTNDIQKIVEALATRLAGHERTRKDDLSVRLGGIGEASYDIDVSVPVETTDVAEFAKIREELLVLCFDVLDASGAKLAVPTRELVTRPA